MFALGSATKIYLATGPTDLRKSFDTLAAVVHNQLKLDPLSGHLFVFCNRRRDRIKILLFDQSGLWLLAKRLEAGCFSWPDQNPNETTVSLNQQELALLLGGVEMQRTARRRWWRRES